jgi:hypothetical protein
LAKKQVQDLFSGFEILDTVRKEKLGKVANFGF